MRSLTTAALLILAALPSQAADRLTLVIGNVPEGGGQLMIQVLGSESAFNDEEPPIASLMLPATHGEVTLTTDALPPGTYGVRVLHDRNGNGEMDTNLVGMPKEPWGFSNDATGTFGPPKWKAARFELRGDTRQHIRLNQP